MPNIYSITSWKVSEDSHGNDHFPIYIRSRCITKAGSFCSYHLNTKSVNWAKFNKNIKLKLNELTETDFTPHYSSLSLITSSYFPIPSSQKYEEFYNMVVDSIHLAQPPSKCLGSFSHYKSNSSKFPRHRQDTDSERSKHKTLPPWWDANCEEARIFRKNN